MRVKICGVTNVADARAAAEAGADFIGLIRAASPRQVSVETARAIAAALPPRACGVLVFRDAPVSEVVAAVEQTGVRWVQLHGREPVADLRRLKAERPDVQLIKAWELHTAQAVPRVGNTPDAGGTTPAAHAAAETAEETALGAAAAELAEYLAAARAAAVPLAVLILDAPKGGPHPGFAALAALARTVTERPPEVWCAGGLTPENVAAACAAGPFDGVDVAGGVERAPGHKDAARVARFVAAVRGTQRPAAGDR